MRADVEELARGLERELLQRAAEVGADPLAVELRQPGTIAVVRDVDEWGVSLVAALLVDELRRRPAARGELVRVCRSEPRLGETGLASYGLVVDRELSA